MPQIPHFSFLGVLRAYIYGEGVLKSKSNIIISDLDMSFSVSHHNVPHKCSFICLPNTSQFQLSCLQMEKWNQGEVRHGFIKMSLIFLFAKTVKERPFLTPGLLV